MFTITRNQTISLAGLYQSLALIQRIAWEGDTSHSCMQPTIASILTLDTKEFIDVYGSLANLTLGLRTLKKTLERRHDRQAIELTRYAINLMVLENKLQQNPRVIALLRTQIKRIHAQYTSTDHCVEEIAQLYRKSISPLGPKMIIAGNPSYLSDRYAQIIRTLLLAGIRAIVLWRQA